MFHSQETNNSLAQSSFTLHIVYPKANLKYPIVFLCVSIAVETKSINAAATKQLDRETKRMILGTLWYLIEYEFFIFLAY